MRTKTVKAQKAPKHPEWSTQPAERFGYCLYFTGQNSIYTLVSVLLTSYLMFSGIDTFKITGVLIAVKVWDAINDAIFGCIFDKVKFKSGRKFLPWLRISLVLIPITTILLFSIPQGADETVKIAWFAVAYLLWDTVYTLCDAPIFGVITSMTPLMSERTSLLSTKTIFGGVGMGLAYLIGNVLVSEKVGLSFSAAAIIVSVIAFICMLPFCLKGKERIEPDKEEIFTLRRMFRYLFKNKYLLIYFLGFFFYSAFGVAMSLNLFVSYFLFHNSLFSLIVLAISVVPTLIMALLVPKMIKKIDKLKLQQICVALMAIISVIIWLVGYDNIIIYIVLCAIRGIPTGVVGVTLFMFTPDCSEYGKFKSGIEAKGITFSLQTFMAKLTAAISSTLGIFFLGFFGWVTINAESFAELEKLNIVQPDSALWALWFASQMLPAIGMVLAFIVWMFYKLRDKDVQLMTECNTGVISREEALQKIKVKL